jgi:hypothetical protein
MNASYTLQLYLMEDFAENYYDYDGVMNAAYILQPVIIENREYCIYSSAIHMSVYIVYKWRLRNDLRMLLISLHCSWHMFCAIESVAYCEQDVVMMRSSFVTLHSICVCGSKRCVQECGFIDTFRGWAGFRAHLAHMGAGSSGPSHRRQSINSMGLEWTDVTSVWPRG